jgi:vitamin B12 transporter
MSLLHPATAVRRIALSFAVVFLAQASVDDVAAQQAQQTSYELPVMTVTATRVPTPEAEIGSSITVITRDEIEDRGYVDLPGILMDVPGLNVVQTGGAGGLTSVYMRGTNANHTKVLIDGIDAGDPSNITGAVDLGHFTAADIERVEVLRGPQSGLYGADAIGGVINIITRAGSGPPRFTAGLEGGSFGTFNQTAGVSGSVARFNYAVDLAHLRTESEQVTPSDLVPPGRNLNQDTYDNKTASAKLGANLTDNFDLGFVIREIDTALDFTGDDVAPETQRSYSPTRQLFTRGTGHLVLFDGALDQTVGIAYTDHRNRFDDPNPATVAFGNDPATNSGDSLKFDWQGNIQFTKTQTLILGAEHETDDLSDTTPTNAGVSNDAGFVQLQSQFGARVFNTLALRYDANSQFGGKATYREAPALLITETGTKLKGSVGTGYKPPSLPQQFDNFPGFGFFGNPNLQPETSFGWDAGFEQDLPGLPVRVGSTYFHNDIHNLIDATFTTYVNVGQVTTWGAENFAEWTVREGLTVRADYTYTVAEDDVAHQELTRRPRNKATLAATWRVTDALTITGSVLYLGPWVDTSREGVPGVIANGYTLVNVAGTYRFTESVAGYVRIDNMLDRHYQDPTGFLRPGLGIFAGIRVALDTGKLGK